MRGVIRSHRRINVFTGHLNCRSQIGKNIVGGRRECKEEWIIVFTMVRRADGKIPKRLR
jgi:hypothetical protein